MKAYDAIGRNNWDKSKFQIGCENRIFLNFQFFPKHAGFQANLNFQFFLNFWPVQNFFVPDVRKKIIFLLSHYKVAEGLKN